MRPRPKAGPARSLPTTSTAPTRTHKCIYVYTNRHTHTHIRCLYVFGSIGLAGPPTLPQPQPRARHRHHREPPPPLHPARPATAAAATTTAAAGWVGGGGGGGGADVGRVCAACHVWLAGACASVRSWRQWSGRPSVCNDGICDGPRARDS